MLQNLSELLLWRQKDKNKGKILDKKCAMIMGRGEVKKKNYNLIFSKISSTKAYASHMRKNMLI